MQGHIDKALQFEQDLAGGLPLHWEVVVHYYAALHWMTAVVIHRLVNKKPPLSVPNFNSHEQLKIAMSERQANVGPSKEALYNTLEKLSRDARYSTRITMTPPMRDKAASLRTGIRTWAIGLLKDHYRLP